MSDDNRSDEGTDALVANLAARADGAEDRSAEVDEESEDIEAFLASLEDGDEGAPAPTEGAGAGEPDPFADAFAELAEQGGGDLDADMAARLAALEAEVPKPKPKPKPEPVAPTPEAVAPAPEPEPIEEPPAAPEPESEPEPEQTALEKVDSKESKQDKKARPAPVETVRSPGFRFAVGALKFGLLIAPVVTFFWLIGSYVSAWTGMGWAVALVATLGAFVLPMVPRFGLKKGRYLWWACALGVLGSAALIAPSTRTSAERVASYGHWPVSVVGQQAGWAPDSTAISASATVAGWVAGAIDSIEPTGEALGEPLALGTTTTLGEYAKSVAPKQAEKKGEEGEAKGAEKAPEAKPDATPEAEKAPEAEKKPSEGASE